MLIVCVQLPGCAHQPVQVSTCMHARVGGLPGGNGRPSDLPCPAPRPALQTYLWHADAAEEAASQLQRVMGLYL